MEAGNYYVLQNDLTLPEKFFIAEFSANLDGGGFTLKASGKNPLFGEITGEVNDELVIDRIFEKFCVGK